MKYEVTMEKRFLFSFEIDVDDISNIDDVIGSYDGRFENSKYYDISYDYAVCDEDGNTLIDWK